MSISWASFAGTTGLSISELGRPHGAGGVADDGHEYRVAAMVTAPVATLTASRAGANNTAIFNNALIPYLVPVCNLTVSA